MEHFNNGFNLIDKAHIDTVKQRFLRISDAIEKSYYSDRIKGEYSYFVGSYGRNTAINTSDIDIMVVLPNHVKNQFDEHNGNGTSHLLQTIKNHISETYPKTYKKGDRQVVVVEFSDGMKFEVLPGFDQGEGAYLHPDTHDGGSWEPTYPFLEQTAMREKNSQCNGLLYDTCRYIRHIRDTCFKDKKLSGIVIDSFVFEAIDRYKWPDQTSNSQIRLYDYIEYLRDRCTRLIQLDKCIVYTPGSTDEIPAKDSFECLWRVLNYWLNLERINVDIGLDSFMVTKSNPLPFNYTGEALWPGVF